MNKKHYSLSVKNLCTNEVITRIMQLDEDTYKSCLKRLSIDEKGFMLIHINEITE